MRWITADRTVFPTSELDFFLGNNFLVTYHEKPLRSVALTEERALKGTAGHIARAPDRVAHSLLDSLVDNYKPAMDELSMEIGELEQLALHTQTSIHSTKFSRSKRRCCTCARSSGRSAKSSRGAPGANSARPPEDGSVFSRRV